MESEDVAAVKVLSTGDSDIRARKTRMEAFKVFAPEQDTGISERNIRVESDWRRTVGITHSIIGPAAFQQFPYDVSCQEDPCGYPDQSARV